MSEVLYNLGRNKLLEMRISLQKLPQNAVEVEGWVGQFTDNLVSDRLISHQQPHQSLIDVQHKVDQLAKGTPNKGWNDPEVAALIADAHAKVLSYATLEWITKYPQFLKGLEDDLRLLIDTDSQHVASPTPTAPILPASHSDGPPIEGPSVTKTSRPHVTPRPVTFNKSPVATNAAALPSVSPSLVTHALASKGASPSSPTIDLTSGSPIERTSPSVRILYLNVNMCL